jgi:hypothetical protein
MRKAQLAATATKTSRKATTTNYAESPTPNLLDPRRRASSISILSHIIPHTEEKLKQCNECQVKFSPKWWTQEMEGGEEVLLCHKCHWRNTHLNEDVEMKEGENEVAGKVIPVGLVDHDSHQLAV